MTHVRSRGSGTKIWLPPRFGPAAGPLRRRHPLIICAAKDGRPRAARERRCLRRPGMLSRPCWTLLSTSVRPFFEYEPIACHCRHIHEPKICKETRKQAPSAPGNSDDGFSLNRRPKCRACRSSLASQGPESTCGLEGRTGSAQLSFSKQPRHRQESKLRRHGQESAEDSNVAHRQGQGKNLPSPSAPSPSPSSLQGDCLS